MHSLMRHLRRGKEDGEPQQQELEPKPNPDPDPPVKPPSSDPNIPKKRLHINQKCLYERLLPGKAYISAHVNRLQHGFYKSNVLHEPSIDNVYFVSVHFVFHPHDPEWHRFKSAEIEVMIHGSKNGSNFRKNPDQSHPRILKHAPELMFGAVSPESLQWNFSLSSSLGVSQAPVSASLNPKAAMKSSYKVFHMLSIQGSVRSMRCPRGSGYDLEDSKAVWTLTENALQKSGLPRDFDFVLLVHKPADIKQMYMTVNLNAEIGSWFGSYPQWYTSLSQYMPSQDCAISFDHDIGQRFLPSQPGPGYNFADLMHTLDEYVMMPGTIYPTRGTRQGGPNPNLIGYQSDDETKTKRAAHPSSQTKQPPKSPKKSKPPTRSSSQSDGRTWAPENVNVRVVLEHQYLQDPEPQRFLFSPSRNAESVRQPSIRRRKSRTGLKEYGAKQALHEPVQHGLENGRDRTSFGERAHGQALSGDAS